MVDGWMDACISWEPHLIAHHSVSADNDPKGFLRQHGRDFWDERLLVALHINVNDVNVLLPACPLHECS